MPEQGMTTIPNLQYYCMTPYDDSFTGVHVIFPKDNLNNTLGEYIAGKGLKQLHIAETEKYAHVTSFINGGREEPFPGEDRILVNSPAVATYDLQPRMSAYEVKDKLVEALGTNKYDWIVVNFANADMVGHTGVYAAIGQAVTVIDDGTPNTAHSTNPVPFIYVTENGKSTVQDACFVFSPIVIQVNDSFVIFVSLPCAVYIQKAFSDSVQLNLDNSRNRISEALTRAILWA
jgi:2,3-bisphosphoglycerate-independent phosphoglycerate mutase